MINKHWDNKHLSGYDTYSINDVGHSEIVNVTSIEEIESVPMKTEAKINVSTIGVEKANTIAIYETNSTTFNGHYQEQERMNILQLYVNDSGTGTPFVEGPNVIVIPTSLFTETVFNAYVQNETLSETPIYSADDEIFMFISVGRDGNTEQACEEIDFVFIRFEISSEDAMEVLTLLLTCLVNETTNETAIVYTYVSTKLNDTTAVLMNLPISVLNFIPWFCNFTESPLGSKPETKDDWFWKALKTLCSWTIGLIVMAIMIPAIIVAMLIVAAVTFLLENLPIFQYILWLIICTIVLIFIWIMFAIMLLLINTVVFGISMILFALSPILDFNMIIKYNRVSCIGDLSFNMGYNIGEEYHDYFALYIPTIVTYFESNDAKFEFNFSLYSFYIGFSKYPNDIINTTLNDWLTFFISMGCIMGLSAGGFGMIAVTAHLIKVDFGASFSTLNALWIMNLILSIENILYSLMNPDLLKPAIIGMGIGFIIASIAAAFPFIFTSIAEDFVFLTTGIYCASEVMMSVKSIVLTLSYYGLLMKLVEELNDDLRWKELDYLAFKCLFSITSGFLGLTLASYALLTIPLIIVRIALAIFTLNLGVAFLTVGIAS